MSKDGDSKPAPNDLSDLQCRIATTNAMSMVLIVLGTILFAFGIPTIILASPNPVYPFSSGLGIYGGLLVIVAGILGMVLLYKGKTSPQENLKAINITYRVFLSIAIDIGAVGFAYGIWAVVLCSRGVSASECGGTNWTANYLLAVITMVLGFCIMVIGIVNYIVVYKVLSRLWDMSKIACGETVDTEMEAKS